MEKVRLELVGITYNQIESGVYAVILQQTGGTRRIPIIIGFPEAPGYRMQASGGRHPSPAYPRSDGKCHVIIRHLST